MIASLPVQVRVQMMCKVLFFFFPLSELEMEHLRNRGAGGDDNK